MDHNASFLARRAAATALIVALAGCQSAGPQPKTVSDDTRARLSQALLASGDRDGAAEALRTPTAREADEAPLVLTNAETLISAGQVDRGMRIAKTALAAQKDDPDFALKVASLAVKASQLSDAAEIYHTILRTHPDTVEALNGEGVVLAQQGELTKAAASLQQALTLSPQDTASRNNLALVMLLSGQNQAALPLLEDLDRTAPSSHVTAMLAEARGRIAAAAGVVAPSTIASVPAQKMTVATK